MQNMTKWSTIRRSSHLNSSFLSNMSTPTLIDTQLHNLEAERSLLGCLLIDPDKLVDVLTVVSPGDFYDPTYRQIFEAIRELYQGGKAIDFVTISAKLSDNKKVSQIGGSAFLAQIAADVPTASHAEHYAQILREKAMRRQMIQSGNRIASLAHEESRPAVELLEQAEEQLFAITRGVTNDHTVPIRDAIAAWHDKFAELYETADEQKLLGIQTGFSDLDHHLVGLDPEEVCVIAGRPGMGKTALALNIAMNVTERQDKRVAIISLEMNRQQLIERMCFEALDRARSIPIANAI